MDENASTTSATKSNSISKNIGQDPAESRFQRPFGCAVLDLAAARVVEFPLSSEIEIADAVPIYRPTRDVERNFQNLHELIISGNRGEYELIPQCIGIKFILAVLPTRPVNLTTTDDFSNKMRDAPTSFRLPSPFLAQISTVAEAIPEVREYLYVTIDRGEFSQGSKSAAKNIAISAYCLTMDGTLIPNCIARGTGKQSHLSSYYSSSVYYHVNNPSINETFHVDLRAIKDLLSAHLFITITHCSTNTPNSTSRQSESFFSSSKDKKARSVFAFCVLPFADPNRGGVIIDDKTHFLECFSPLSSMDLTNFDGSGRVSQRVLAGNSKTTAPYLLPTQEKSKMRRALSSSYSTTYEQLSLKTTVFSMRYTSVRAIHAIMHWDESTKESSLAADIGDCMTLSDNSIFQHFGEILKSLVKLISEKPMLVEASFKLLVKLLAMLHKASLQIQSANGVANGVSGLMKYSKELVSTFTKDTSLILLHTLNTILADIASAPGSIQQQSYDGYFHRTVYSIPSILHLVDSYEMLCNSVPDGERQDRLKAEMQSAVQHINKIMECATTETEVIKSIRSYMFGIFETLSRYFTVEETAVIGESFLVSIHKESKPTKKHATKESDRVIFMKKMLSSNVFADVAGRSIMLNTTLRILTAYTTSKNASEKSIAMELLQILLEKLEKHGTDNDFEAAKALLPVLLEVLLYNFSSGNESEVKHDAVDSLTMELATINLCSLISLLGKDRLTEVMQNGSNGQEGSDIAVKLLATLTLLIKRSILPSPWLLMHMALIATTKDIIMWVTSMLVKNSSNYLDMTKSWESSFTGAKDFNVIHGTVDDITSSSVVTTNLALWMSLFETAFTVLLEPGLDTQSDEMNPARKKYLNENYADVRILVIDAIVACWNEILVHPNRGVLGTKLSGHFTVPFIAAACSLFDETSKMGRRLLIDILSIDFEVHGDFPCTACHIYDSVSATLLRVRKDMNRTSSVSMAVEQRYLAPHSSLVKFMETDMDELFGKHPVLDCDKAHLFASEMRELLRLLLDLSNCAKTSEYEEERSFAYSKLMDFLLRMNRQDAYIKFAHSLSKEMERLDLPTEAANAVLLHFNLLEWNKDVLESIDIVEEGIVFHSEPSWQRKRALCEMCIALFENGQAFESCIELLEELANFYKFIIPDYVALSKTLERQVTYYQYITSVERYFPTMFRVGYYGLGFTNTAIRNKEFIYRGQALESIIDFSNRIKKKYPNCEILAPKVNASQEEHMSVFKQFIQISKVTSASIEESNGEHAPDLTKLPPYIRVNIMNNKVCCFFYQRPFRKRAVKSANEFLDLWVEKRFLITAGNFPSYTRRAEVSSVAIVIFNPIEMAIVGLEERNADLAEKNSQMAAIADGAAGQSFTMALRYVIVIYV